MGKKLSDDYMDKGLEDLEANGDLMVICEGEPTDYADATTAKGSGGKKIGEHAMTAGDYTIANGDTSGRKITVAAQSGINIDVAGDADHVAIVDVSETELMLVTTISPAKTGLAVSDEVNVPAFDDEIADPT